MSFMHVSAKLLVIGCSPYMVFDLSRLFPNISPKVLSPPRLSLADCENLEEAEACVEEISLFTTYTDPKGDLSESSPLSQTSSIL